MERIYKNDSVHFDYDCQYIKGLVVYTEYEQSEPYIAIELRSRFYSNGHHFTSGDLVYFYCDTIENLEKYENRN